jgi:hypothetical protein
LLTENQENRHQYPHLSGEVQARMDMLSALTTPSLALIAIGVAHDAIVEAGNDMYVTGPFVC